MSQSLYLLQSDVMYQTWILSILLLTCTNTTSPAFAGEVFLFLLSGKRHTVCALILGRIAFMGADLNLAQRAVVLQIAMMGTLTNSALNCSVCLIVHRFPSLDVLQS